MTLNIIEVEVGIFALFIGLSLSTSFVCYQNMAKFGIVIGGIIVAISVPTLIYFCFQLWDEMINFNDDLPEAE